MTTSRYANKINKFCAFGLALAELSTCKRAKQGAVIFTRSCSEVLAIGYNGPARALDNDSCNDSVGACGCVHAEANAIMRLDRDRAKLHGGVFMFGTMTPCQQCAALIANSNVIRAYFYEEVYRDETGLDLIQQSGMVTCPARAISRLSTHPTLERLRA